ncbi:hypothetical protein PDG61_24340 [Mycolicibacterium sp. BiH015]|uniref:hypothetical protein n=1 Tax=Mycolicibacterium sp. BiH015 TaxID=3018808 RepID=UPI0022DFB8EA|nr:hypothetical protein [Mycolicibacterium sp. BiH015]MDA2894059.1 hypothetical protein [Mycolicibacterium sp. BiH015]
MKLQVLPYVTVEVDDRLRRRLRRAGERFRVNVRAYLLSAADDVDTAVDSAIRRVDSVVAGVNNKISPDSAQQPTESPRLRVVGGREAS